MCKRQTIFLYAAAVVVSATCLNNIIERESGGRVNATNPPSGAYGIPQALPDPAGPARLKNGQRGRGLAHQPGHASALDDLSHQRDLRIALQRLSAREQAADTY